MTKLQELSSKVYYDMGNYSQLIIDLVQEADSLLLVEEKEFISTEDVGALSYDITCIMEVIDKTRTHDVEALETLHEIVSERIHEITR